MRTPAACLPSETRRVSNVEDGKLFVGEDHIAIQVGDGYLCSRNKVQAILGYKVHLTLLVGKLPGAITRSFIHDDRRLHFAVSTFACLIKEKVYERPLKLCSLTLVHRKART